MTERFLGGSLAICVAALWLASPAFSRVAQSNPAGGMSESPQHIVAAFNVETAKYVASAAATGINTDILYGGPPPAGEPVTEALASTHTSVIDGRISEEVFKYECHRVHTVAPPPPEESTYCQKDIDPSVDSIQAVLKAIEPWIAQDASNPLVSGYWILDDWPAWDGGSARQLLKEVHGAIEQVTPNYPAICGFAGDIGKPGEPTFAAEAEAKNFSTEGCSMVGLYNYAFPLTHKRTNGKNLDWSMKTVLAEETEQLAANGWSQTQTPLLGIGQAWGGRYETPGSYMAGLTESEIREQALAYCSAGASAIGWYAWNETGYIKGTKYPAKNKKIRHAIQEAINACGF